jgi:hypothetical protein
MLGQGKLTVTFRARAVERLSAVETQDFTLKMLREEFRRPDVESRFLVAARALQWSAPPGTATVAEIGEAPGQVFAAFEFTEGVNLRQLRDRAVAKDAQMDARLVGLIGRKLAERLRPLHAQADGPSVHGSLSPGNVLVRPSGEILLLDCGFGEALRSRKSWPSESWRFATPEQLRGEPALPGSDIYAVGALMYFLCFGRPPYEADSPAELEAYIVQGLPSFEGLHPAVAASMARLLSRDIEARPKSASEVARQISVALLSANAGIAFNTSPPLAAGLVASARPEPEPPQEVEDEGASDFDEFAVEAPIVEMAMRAGATAPRPSMRGGISADDPDVGAVFDDDDEEDQIEVAADGTVKRRRRRRAVRLLAWTKSAFARKIFRYAWMPAAVLLLAAAVEGYFFTNSWRAARAESARKDAERAAEEARKEAAKPKLAKAPAIPNGHLVLKVGPRNAAVWLDGKEVGSTPSTILTEPGTHRLVITAAGYRMLRDVVDTTHGALFEREMVPAIFPITGSVGLNVACTTEGKYPVFVDGKEIGAFCPIAGVRLDPGKHMVGLFVIPLNRIWSYDRDIVADHPHRVQFNY